MIKISIGEINETLKEVIAGILIYGFVVEIIGIIVSKHKLSFTLGTLLGIITAVGLIIHMYYRIDEALDMDRSNAVKHTMKGYAFRLVVVVVVLILGVIFPKYLNVVGICLGIMGLKAGVYIQPFAHKYLSNKNKKRRR